MKTTPATVENTFQRGMGINFCDGKDVPNSDSNFINNTDNLGFDGSECLFDNDDSICDCNVRLFDIDDSHHDSNVRLFDSDERNHDSSNRNHDSSDRNCDNNDRNCDNDCCCNDRDERYNDSDSLNRFCASIRSVVLLMYSYLTTCKFSNVKLVLKIKYSIYNNKGVHFNLDFINYRILRILFLIFKILFNKKHQYWCEPSYFS